MVFSSSQNCDASEKKNCFRSNHPLQFYSRSYSKEKSKNKSEVIIWLKFLMIPIIVRAFSVEMPKLKLFSTSQICVWSH
eukprot:UN12591